MCLLFVCILPFAQTGRNSGCRECFSKGSPCRCLHSSWPPCSTVGLLPGAPVRTRRIELQPSEQVLAWEEKSLRILRDVWKGYIRAFQDSFDSQPSLYSPSLSTSITFFFNPVRTSSKIPVFLHYTLPLSLPPFLLSILPINQPRFIILSLRSSLFISSYSSFISFLFLSLPLSSRPTFLVPFHSPFLRHSIPPPTFLPFLTHPSSIHSPLPSPHPYFILLL